MDNRQKALLVLAVGILFILVGLLSDVIGFGSEGFGPVQAILIVVGAGAVGYGLWRYRLATKDGG